MKRPDKTGADLLRNLAGIGLEISLTVLIMLVGLLIAIFVTRGSF